jgi:signal transduction histidine kinase
MLSHRFIPNDWSTDRDTPVKTSKIRREIGHKLDGLVRYGMIAGVCAIWKRPQRRQRYKAIAQTDASSVYPLPPLPRIEALLRSLPEQSDSLYIHNFGTQVIPGYYLYGCWLEGVESRSSYLLAWHPVELQPWQHYMFQQQALLLQMILQPVLAPQSFPLFSLPQSQSHSLRQSSLPELNTSPQSLQAVQDVEHQLRTPLTLIQLYANLLQQQLPVGEIRSQVDRITATVETVQASLKNLCQGQLRQRPRRHHTDLRLLLLDVLETVQPLLDRKRINLALDLQSCPIPLDAWQIRQVLQNILDNAIFFSPEAATISCRCVGFQQAVLIQIADQGAGLSVQDQQHLFQTHYSGRSGGSGLGLAIAKQIIQHHAGNIWGENLPIGGAQFSISLPR